MRGLINDIFKKKDGYWDKQAIILIVSFIMCIVLGTTITVLSFYLNIVVNSVADNVFNSFIMLTCVMSGTNIWNKIVDMKKTKNE